MNKRTLYFCKQGYNHAFHKQDLQSIQSIIGESIKSIMRDNVTLDLWTVFKKKFYILTTQKSVLFHLDPDNDSGTIAVTRMTNQPPDVDINLDLSCSYNCLIPYVVICSQGL